MATEHISSKDTNPKTWNVYSIKSAYPIEYDRREARRRDFQSNSRDKCKHRNMRWTDSVCFIETGGDLQFSLEHFIWVPEYWFSTFCSIWWMENVQQCQLTFSTKSTHPSEKCRYPTTFFNIKFGLKVMSMFWGSFIASITIWNGRNIAATCNQTELLPAPLHSKQFQHVEMTHFISLKKNSDARKKRDQLWSHVQSFGLGPLLVSRVPGWQRAPCK